MALDAYLKQPPPVIGVAHLLIGRHGCPHCQDAGLPLCAHTFNAHSMCAACTCSRMRTHLWSLVQCVSCPHLLCCCDTAMRAAWLQAVRREGVLSAYRGFGAAVGSTFVYKALYFGLYVSPF